MQLFDEQRVETRAGAAYLTVTQADRVYMRGEFEVRGTKYSAHIHWLLGPEGKAMVDIVSVDTAWNGPGSSVGETAPKAVRTKIVHDYRQALERFVLENSPSFSAIERNAVEREIAAAKKRAAEFKVKLTKCEAEISDLESRLEKLK